MERDKALDAALGQIEKQFGKGSVMRMGDRVDMGIESISTGAMSLDLALGIGGLPRGRVVEIFGPESSGKSTLALHVVAEAQRNGGVCAYIDAEHALDPVYASAIGVDIDQMLISQPDTGEQALEIADMLIRSGAIDVIVIDSVAALTPRAEIEGEMGDSHMGLQARLMSQALRKITGTLSKSNTIAIFINQLREKIGVMFGCFSYDTRVVLADGSTEKIGKIVNQKLAVDVLSYDPALGSVVPKRVVNWFDNGKTDEFLQFTVAKPRGNGRAQFACTPNHQIRTPSGWCEAGELRVGDAVLEAVTSKLSDFQWEVVLGSLMGDGALSPTRSGYGARFRYGHGPRQIAYADWKASLLGNIDRSRSGGQQDAAVFYDFEALPELAEVRQAVYSEGKKVFSDDYLKQLTPLSLALWYMDDGSFSLRAKGIQERTKDGSGRAEICIEAMEPTTRTRLVDYLADTWDLHPTLRMVGAGKKAVLVFAKDETAKLHALIAPFVHPSMEYKLLPKYRGRFAVEPAFMAPRIELAPFPVLDIHVKPPSKKTHRFDIEVEGSHNYLVDDVVVHNSPETTPGGRALKFYSSVRLDIRRVESIKDGAEVVGNRTRVKVVKNKCVAEGTRVFDPTTGLTHRIEEIVEGGAGAAVIAADKAGKLHVRPIIQRMDQGEHEVIGLKLRDGTVLRVTADHRVLTDSGWHEAGELHPGDRVARPRRALGFGTKEPVTPDQARMLGYLIGDGCVSGKTPISFTNIEAASEKMVPAAFFDPEVSAEVIANLLFGMWETDGYISREQTGGIRCGFTTTSEQLAHQIRWLLRRWGIASSVSQRDPRQQRPSIVKGRPIVSKLLCYQVRITGIDNVSRFAEVIPMWGPKGLRLTAELANPALRVHRGSAAVYLGRTATAPVLAYLTRRGVTAELAARLIGDGAGDPKGGLKQVLGVSRIRRDHLQKLAEALESDFLYEMLDEDVWYDRIVAIEPPEWKRIFDLEVAEDHTFVADDVVVSNCSSPFRSAEFDIMYGKGISREGSILDVAVDLGIVKKSGAWYTYEGEQLGQGRENTKSFLRESPELLVEIDQRVRNHGKDVAIDVPLGMGIGDDEPISVE